MKWLSSDPLTLASRSPARCRPASSLLSVPWLVASGACVLGTFTPIISSRLSCEVAPRLDVSGPRQRCESQSRDISYFPYGLLNLYMHLSVSPAPRSPPCKELFHERVAPVMVNMQQTPFQLSALGPPLYLLFRRQVAVIQAILGFIRMVHRHSIILNARQVP
jgi:hypothetical protein